MRLLSVACRLRLFPATFGPCPTAWCRWLHPVRIACINWPLPPFVMVPLNQSRAECKKKKNNSQRKIENFALKVSKNPHKISAESLQNPPWSYLNANMKCGCVSHLASNPPTTATLRLKSKRCSKCHLAVIMYTAHLLSPPSPPQSHLAIAKSTKLYMNQLF